jgi:hypothetical protein
MEDITRYLDEFVDPTIKDFRENPTSVRHAFLACVVTFHAIDYLTPPGSKPRDLRQKFSRQSSNFATVDDVAHAFKHVLAGDRADPRLRASEVIARSPAFFGLAVWDLSQWGDTQGGVTLDRNRQVDLLDTLKRAVDFLRAKAKTHRRIIPSR